MENVIVMHHREMLSGLTAKIPKMTTSTIGWQRMPPASSVACNITKDRILKELHVASSRRVFLEPYSPSKSL